MDAGQPYARGIVSALGVVVCALGTVVLAACGSTSATDITTPGAVRCAATVSAPSTVVPASGGPVSVTVSAARDCTWSAESQASWLKLATTSGQGTATISVNAATNDAASARSGSVTVNDQRLDFNQEGRGCSISLSGPDGAVAAAGVSQSLTITTLSGCPWTIAPSAPWVVPEVTSGSGTATVAYVVQPNAGGAREATLAVGAATFLVSQAAAPAPAPAPVPAPACTFTLSAASADFPATGGQGAVGVASQAGCGWSVSGGASWVTIKVTGGSGDGNVTYTVDANTSLTARQVTLTIAGRAYTITQQGISCAITIAPPSQSFAASGGNGAIQVTAPGGCAWTATSNAAWVQVGTPTGSGPGPVTYLVQENTATAPRTAAITIGGQTHTVSQAGAALPCTYDVTPASRTFTASGGPSTVHVATGTGCTWTAVSSVPWITIAPSAAAGSGTADIAYTVGINTSTTSRSGTVTVAGKVQTITQDGSPAGCTYTLSPGQRTFDRPGGTGTVTVTTGAGCTWTAVSSATFVTVLTPVGVGTADITYVVDMGMGNVDRTATITVNGQVHTIRQVRMN